MYLRFVTSQIDRQSGAPQGLFRACYALEDAGELASHEREWFRDVVGWFERHLPVPKAYDLRRAKGPAAQQRVLFWFKEEAVECIQRMQHVALMLGHHGVATRMLRSDKPGRIVYSDSFQVGVVPYRDESR